MKGDLEGKRVLAIGAHPDDVEFFCSGTLLLLRNAGAGIHVATMTLGDCGSSTLSAAEVSRVRVGEARAACEEMGARYHHLDFTDAAIFYDDASCRRVTGLLREVNPWMVFTHPPEDYMVDHEMTSRLVRAACFIAPVPNYLVPGCEAPPADSVPYLFYGQPVEGMGILGRRARPGFLVDVSDQMALKERLLACHASQREWLRSHHGIDEYLDSLRRWDGGRGQEAARLSGRSVEYAEGFWQHLGHAYPADNPLELILGDRFIPGRDG